MSNQETIEEKKLGASSLIHSWKAYRKLTPRQKDFIGSRKIAEQRPLNDWLRFFRVLGSLDRYGDKARSISGGWAVLGFVLIFFSFIANAIAEFKSEPVLMITAGTAGLGALLMIVFGANFLNLRRVDVPNTLRKFLLPVFMLLKEDVHRKTPPRVELDLTGAEEKEKLIKQWEAKGTAGWTRAGILSEKYFVYRDAWASGNMRLVDGSVLKWQIVDVIRRRDRRKRNARGKTKTKTKYKIKRLIRAELRPLKSQYAVNAGGDEVELIKEDERRAVLRSRRRIDYVEYNLNNLYDRDFVGEFLEVVGGLMKTLQPRA